MVEAPTKATPPGTRREDGYRGRRRLRHRVRHFELPLQQQRLLHLHFHIF